MGIYVNPGNHAFREALNSRIYVDKTELIAYTNAVMNTYNKFICVSRPRRFGKTMAADMLVSYYSRGCHSDSLFAGRRIAAFLDYPEHLNRHNVIRIDVQQFMTKDLDTLIERIQEKVILELRREYPDFPELSEETDLQIALNELYLHIGNGFVFIIDEWDCVFRIAKEREDLQKDYLDFLRRLFKGAAYVDLVYMTGILPIKKYGEHSAVNMFDEFSMVEADEFATFFGFTENEVREKCREYQIDYEQMQRWYDGYLLDGTHIYNPESVVSALCRGKIRSYWAGTETYDALKIYIERNFDGLRESVVEMLGGGTCRVDTTSFQNDMTTFRSKDDVLTLLIHLGYLTYDREEECASIPNLEIEQEFVRAVKNGEGWGGLMDSLNRSAQLLEDTWRMDGDAVASAIEKIHAETTSLFRYHDENALACVLYIAYYSAGSCYMKPLSELPAGQGRADVVYLPLKNVNRPALVVELKWSASAQSAIEQIKEKRYTQWIEEYTGDILLVGIAYDKKSKKHSCVIEKYNSCDLIV